MQRLLSWLSSTQILVSGAIILAVTSLISIILVVVVYGFAPESAALFTAWATIVGVVITQIVATRLARSNQKEQQELEDRRARAASLQSYLEQMGKLLAEDKERDIIPTNRTHSDKPRDLYIVVRAETLAVLEGLEGLGSDPTRKRILLQFLYEADLIKGDKPRVSLVGANLRKADLSYIYLVGVNLDGTSLQGAKLQEARLRNANLRHDAHLMEANLFGADLQGANLEGANLSGAILTAANLSGARLTGARVKPAQLDAALSLDGIVRPDGSKHE